MRVLPHRILKSLLRIAAGVLTGFLLLILLSPCFLNRLMFHPPRTENFAVSHPLIQIPVEGQTVTAIYLPPPPENPAAPVVIFSHGNAEDLSSMEYLLREFRAHGYGVIAYDYEGYGKSTGSPAETAVCRDAAAVWQYLVKDCGISPERILSVGYSIGSGPATYLASTRKVRALVLLAPIASAYQAVLPFGLWGADAFPNAERIRKVQAPVLIFHGDADRVVPIRNGRKIFANAHAPKEFVLLPGIRHGDLIDRILPDLFWKKLDEILKKNNVQSRSE